ncbi:MAG: cellulase family glycosylhydrolase [Flavobacterium sp.]
MKTTANIEPAITTVSIVGEQFYINGKPTYQGMNWNGHTIEGLLMNSRMVNGIYDDENPVTREAIKYPDTKIWDADRNTNEFVQAMDEWYNHGLRAITLNLQGGSPLGYGNKGWINSGIDANGDLKPAYMQRMDKILKKADAIGMVVIVGIYYFGQDQYVKDEAAVIKGVDNTLNWLFEKKYRHVLIEVNNECDIKEYDHAILKQDRVHELIQRVRNTKKNGYRYLVGTSYKGQAIPKPNVVKVSDFILLHGNNVIRKGQIEEMVDQTRKVDGYKPMPIVFNEDDHYDFNKEENNMISAVKKYSSWGFFDYRRKGESLEEGYQSIPVNWTINSQRKKEFFNAVKEMTSGNKR